MKEDQLKEETWEDKDIKTDDEPQKSGKWLIFLKQAY